MSQEHEEQPANSNGGGLEEISATGVAQLIDAGQARPFPQRGQGSQIAAVNLGGQWWAMTDLAEQIYRPARPELAAALDDAAARTVAAAVAVTDVDARETAP